ncbi:putative uncharacterized protein [Clostridium sp. CAG:1013]|nr:putative uncharacterized protein [Clostridium sp. CAG:1013]
MKRVLLVDDEFLVCSFMKGLIPWEQYGFTVAGQAENGKAALRKMEECQPDLVFLDVSMPDMDGIEVIRQLNKRYPNCRVVMLSSYSDFEYVREAMRYGASDYLLKHQLTPEELIKTLQELEFPAASQEKPLPPPVEKPDGILRDSQTVAFLRGTSKTIPSALLSLRRPVPVIVKIKASMLETLDWQGGKSHSESMLDSLISTCVQVCSQEQGTRIIDLSDFLLLFLFSARASESEDSQLERVTHTMNIVHDAVLKYHSTHIVWKTGSRCEDLHELPGFCAQEKEDMEENVYHKAGDSGGHLLIQQEQQLIVDVASKDRGDVRKVLASVFAPIVKEPKNTVELSLLVGDLFSLAVRLYRENQVPVPNLDQHAVRGNDPKEARQYFEKLFLDLIDNVEQSRQYSDPVQQVIGYVQKHYAEPIGLAEVAEYCSLNQSYLSTLFKKETGIGVIHFINRVRVYAAGKLMLTEGALPTHLFERVGFRNYNNFFNLFQTVTGMTPTQFRKYATAKWISEFELIPGKNTPKK